MLFRSLRYDRTSGGVEPDQTAAVLVGAMRGGREQAGQRVRVVEPIASRGQLLQCLPAHVVWCPPFPRNTEGVAGGVRDDPRANVLRRGSNPLGEASICRQQRTALGSGTGRITAQGQYYLLRARPRGSKRGSPIPVTRITVPLQTIGLRRQRCRPKCEPL
jgi:hypothetical protein